MATTLTRPGTYITETLLPGRPPVGPQSPPTAFVGENPRGPGEFVRVTSWSEYTKMFGPFDGTYDLPYAVYAYFQNGGKVAYVARVIGSAGVAATIDLEDRHATTPDETMSVTAHNVGTWGNDVNITITDGTDTGLFNLTVYYDGTDASNIVERWVDMSIEPDHSRYVETVINGNSTYIVVDVDATNATTAPLNIPELQANTPLLTGANPSAATQAQEIATVELLNGIEQPLLLVVPGQTNTTNVNDIIDYALTRGDIFYIVDPPDGNDVATVITYADGLTRSSYAALYYPWVTIPDPGSTARNALKSVPPSGAVAGQYVSNDISRGVSKTPAGVNTILNGVVDIERRFTFDELGDLNTAQVNALKPLIGRGVAIYGGRTLRKTFDADRYIGPRRTLISIKRALLTLTEFAHFENNDSRLWGAITNDVTVYLKDLWQSGGLFGSSQSEAFYVVCDESNNADLSIEQGVVNLEVGVALQYPAEFVVVTLTQIRSGSSSTVETF